MFDKKRLVDTSKNILILLLFLSSLLLLSKAVYFDPGNLFGGLGGLFGSSELNTGTLLADGPSKLQGPDPMFILVTTADGSHFSAKYNRGEKEALASLFSAAFSEALGSAEPPEAVSHSALQSALQLPGVFFDYVYPQALSSIATWLGTEVSPYVSAELSRRLYLSVNGDRLSLFFVSHKDNQVYRCDTASAAASLLGKINEIPLGDSAFAFELPEEYAKLDPYFILSNENSQVSQVSSANPLRQDFVIDKLLELFGMNVQTTFESPVADGSSVYFEGSKSLRVDINGGVLFSVTGGLGIPIYHQGNSLLISERIAAAAEIVQGSIGMSCGDARPILSQISDNTLLFNYTVGGLPILVGDNNFAAKIQIENDEIVRVELNFRLYSFTGATLSHLPERQAVALALESGGEPLLVLLDSSSGVQSDWIRNKTN